MQFLNEHADRRRRRARLVGQAGVS
jgi:hypothetical protein